MRKLGTMFFALAATTAGIASAQEAAAPEGDSAAGVSVAEVVIATSVADHEPVGTATSFARGPSRLVCFVRVENPERAESAILVA